jgi:hypothetical protein
MIYQESRSKLIKYVVKHSNYGGLVESAKPFFSLQLHEAISILVFWRFNHNLQEEEVGWKLKIPFQTQKILHDDQPKVK